MSSLIKAERNDLVALSPVEVADLVLKERMKNNIFNVHSKTFVSTTKSNLKINDSDIEPGEYCLKY